MVFPRGEEKKKDCWLPLVVFSLRGGGRNWDDSK